MKSCHVSGCHVLRPGSRPDYTHFAMSKSVSLQFHLRLHALSVQDEISGPGVMGVSFPLASVRRPITSVTQTLHLHSSIFFGTNKRNRGSVNSGFQTVVRVWPGEQIPAPHFNLIFQTLFYLNFSSFLPLKKRTQFLPQCSLCSAGNLEPRFETTANRPLETRTLTVTLFYV